MAPETDAINSQPAFFDAEWYLNAYPDVSESGINPLEHFLRIGSILGRRAGPHDHTPRLPGAPSLLKQPSQDLEAVIGWIDSPIDGELVGHDYINVSGWCYLGGEDIESVRAEIKGARHSTLLEYGSNRSDIARVHPHFRYFNVGFQGEIYPYVNHTKTPELLVTARTRGNTVLAMHKILTVELDVADIPANRNASASEVLQTINGSLLFH